MGSDAAAGHATEEALRDGALTRGASPARPTWPPRARAARRPQRTPDYKRHLARVLTRRALEAAAGS
jgi:CO/xanthine dehydrogenase FAD-binding subunit